MITWREERDIPFPTFGVFPAMRAGTWLKSHGSLSSFNSGLRSVLQEMGVKAVFGPGTSTSDIVDFIRQAVAERGERGAD